MTRMPSQNRVWCTRRYTRLLGVGDHWFRPAHEDPWACAFNGCDRPYYQHWLAVGEWMLDGSTRRARMYARAKTRLTGGDR
jgi:hypothetical protein